MLIDLTQLERHWLRRMKHLTKRASELNGTRKLALSILARLPSGWTALVALSKGQMKSDPQAALEYANRAIHMNPAVWQGHRQRVMVLERLDRLEAARQARLLGFVLMTESSLERMIEHWFPDVSLGNRVEACRHCSVNRHELGPVLSELAALSGPSTRITQAMRVLTEVYGLQEIARLVETQDELSVPQALALARLLRDSGAVRRPLALLERLPPTPAIERLIAGSRQDSAALDGTLRLDVGPRRAYYEATPRSSFYLLHNSLPHNSGGYATRSHGLLRALRKQDWGVIPITRPGFPARQYVFDQDPRAPRLDQVDGVTYHRLLGKVNAQPRTDVHGFVRLYSDALAPLIRRNRPAIIHAASNWWNGLAASVTAAEHGIPSVYEIRGLWEVTRASSQPGWESSERYEADAGYETMAAMMADRVIVITEGLRDEMIRRGIPAEKIRVVPNAVDISKFSYRSYDSALAAELSLQDEIVIGFAGTLTSYEGLDDLLRAGALVRERTATPIRFLFVGDGPALESLRALATELNLADICQFVGRVPHTEVSRFLSLMAITPFPRKPLLVTELVSPLKPLESMATGAVVLASDVQALKEMVPDDAGLTFTKGDTADLADNLQRLIENPGLRSRLSANARAWIESHRTWREVSTMIIELYDELQS